MQHESKVTPDEAFFNLKKGFLISNLNNSSKSNIFFNMTFIMLAFLQSVSHEILKILN